MLLVLSSLCTVKTLKENINVAHWIVAVVNAVHTNTTMIHGKIGTGKIDCCRKKSKVER